MAGKERGWVGGIGGRIGGNEEEMKEEEDYIRNELKS